MLLCALLEKHLLLASHDVAGLMPVAAALCHLLSPLSFAGVFIPFLPAALHPEPETLVNHTPTPFIIGVEKQTLPLLQACTSCTSCTPAPLHLLHHLCTSSCPPAPLHRRSAELRLPPCRRPPRLGHSRWPST